MDLGRCRLGAIVIRGFVVIAGYLDDLGARRGDDHP